MATLEECRQRLIEKFGRDTSVTLYMQTDGYITISAHQHLGPGRLRRMEAVSWSADCTDGDRGSELERLSLACDRMLAKLDAGEWDPDAETPAAPEPSAAEQVEQAVEAGKAVGHA